MRDDAMRLLRDSLFVGVGFGVLGFQKLQVRRRELEKALDEHVGGPLEQLGRLVGRAP